MKRAYAEEMEALANTYGWAMGSPIDAIIGFVRRAAGLPLYVVGSGGSLSAAVFVSLLHQWTGTMSKYITPLELQEFDRLHGRCAVLLISASGNNVDIMAALEKSVSLEPALLGVVCASEDNGLTRRASKHGGIHLHAMWTPAGRDGFLATNSLLATEVWMARAYGAIHGPGEEPEARPGAWLHDGASGKRFAERMAAMLRPLENKDTIIVLHDGWGKAAAFDLESKLTEAGLAAVQLADYRNFAHGRHNWVDKNRTRTGIIALVTPRCATLAAKTLDLVPKYTPVVKLVSGQNGPAASLNLLVKAMHAVQFFGRMRGIDPGSPVVAKFGREMHHLTVPGSDLGPSAPE